MKKLNTLITCVLLLMGSLSFGQVTVNIKDMSTISGQTIPANGPIQIAPNSNVRLQFLIDLSKPSAQVVDGTLRVYTKRNASDFTAIAVTGVNQFINDNMWNNNTTFMTSGDVTIPASNFNATGGVLYAEFESSSGVKYKSSDWSVTVNSGDNPPPPPSGSPTLKLFSGSHALDGGGFLPFYKNYAPLSGVNKIGIAKEGEIKIVLRYHILFPDNYDCSDGKFQLFAREGSSAPVAIEGATTYIGGHCNGPIDFYRRMEATIKADLFANSGRGYLYCQFKSNGRTVNTSGLMVELVAPIVGNFISGSQSISEGTVPVPFVTGRVRHQVPRGDTPIPGDFTFQWQRKTGNTFTFAGSITNDPGFDPGALTETTSYRRIAMSLGLVSVSNAITVEVNELSDNNTICCDQEVAYGEQPTAITGVVPSGIGAFTYRWETKSRGRWSQISDATSKDYTPEVVTSGRGTITKRFRRVVIPGSGAPLISNIVGITYKLNRRGRKVESLSSVAAEGLSLYPNPVATTLQIEAGTDISDVAVTVVDRIGRTYPMEMAKMHRTSSHTMSIDVRHLPVGLYRLLIAEEGEQPMQRSFIKE